jgi:peptidoglycan/xylan/chitin deacetylase (PgdA/CDA1 family)
MKKIIVTTSWDDGHKLDLKLAKLLKKYNINGTFYVCPDNREFNKSDLLSDEEIKQLSEGFEIGAHTVTHPRLTKVSLEEAEREISESKKYLEKLTGKRISVFCYPGGKYNGKIKNLVSNAGFLYARTIKRHCFQLDSDLLSCGTSVNAYNHVSDLHKILVFSRFNPVEFFKCLDWEYLAKRMFDKVLENGGVYHLWSHSWEIEKYHEWDKLERVLEYISKKENVSYFPNGGLF